LESDIGIYQLTPADNGSEELTEKLFINQFVQSGLVTQAGVILLYAYKFFIISNILSLDKGKNNKGKSTYNVCEASNAAGLLVAKECFSFQNYITGFRLIQLLIGENWLHTSQEYLNIPHIFSQYSESLELLLQNVFDFYLRS
jgi:hypothetical protein